MQDPEIIGDLEHRHHDTFRVVWRNRAMREEWVWFTLAYPISYYRVARMEKVR